MVCARVFHIFYYYHHYYSFVLRCSVCPLHSLFFILSLGSTVVLFVVSAHTHAHFSRLFRAAFFFDKEKCVLRLLHISLSSSSLTSHRLPSPRHAYKEHMRFKEFHRFLSNFFFPSSHRLLPHRCPALCLLTFTTPRTHISRLFFSFVRSCSFFLQGFARASASIAWAHFWGKEKVKMCFTRDTCIRQNGWFFSWHYVTVTLLTTNTFFLFTILFPRHTHIKTSPYPAPTEANEKRRRKNSQKENPPFFFGEENKPFSLCVTLHHGEWVCVCVCAVWSEHISTQTVSCAK